MILQPPAPAEPHSITGISDADVVRIRDFLQGAVYCWCKNRPNEWFSMRDLMGGANNDWTHTPLQSLYINRAPTHPNAIEQAGQDSGWLLKRVIINDARTFETRNEGYIREYRWIASEQ